MKWKWADMMGEEQRAITTISDLAGPTEDVAFREYCTEHDVWTPKDLLYPSGLEGNTLMLDHLVGNVVLRLRFCPHDICDIFRMTPV